MYCYFNITTILALTNAFLALLLIGIYFNSADTISGALGKCNAEDMVVDLSLQANQQRLDTQTLYQEKTDEILNRITSEANAAHNSLALKINNALQEIDFLATKISDLHKVVHDLTRATRENTVVMPCNTRDKDDKTVNKDDGFYKSGFGYNQN